MRQTLSTLQKVKTGVHTLQAILIFIAGCVTIAVFTTGGGSTDGRTKWYFAVCWLSLPALIYLVAVPIWSRAANVAKALWFAIVDSLFAIFWLSAFASVLSWTNEGVREGAKDQKKAASDGDCTTFKYGSEKKCSLSYTANGFGVTIFLLFLITAGISIFYTMKVKKNPQADDPWLKPESAQSYKPTGMGDVEDSKAWDHNTQELDGHQDAESDDERDRPSYGVETSDGHHPGRPWGSSPFDDSHAAPAYQEDTVYRGSTNYQPPSAMSPTDVYNPQYRDTTNYGSGRSRQGAGYSFSAPHADA